MGHFPALTRQVYRDKESLKSVWEVSVWVRVSVWISKVHDPARHGSTDKAEPKNVILVLNVDPKQRGETAENSFSFFSSRYFFRAFWRSTSCLSKLTMSPGSQMHGRGWHWFRVLMLHKQPSSTRENCRGFFFGICSDFPRPFEMCKLDSHLV